MKVSRELSVGGKSSITGSKQEAHESPGQLSLYGRLPSSGDLNSKAMVFQLVYIYVAINNFINLIYPTKLINRLI